MEPGAGFRATALTWQTAERWTVDLYADHERPSGPRDRNTLQIFVVRQPDEKRALIGRVDRLFQPGPKGDDIACLPFDPGARATMLMGAPELRVTPRLRLAPNTGVTL